MTLLHTLKYSQRILTATSIFAANSNPMQMALININTKKYTIKYNTAQMQLKKTLLLDRLYDYDTKSVTNIDNKK